MCLRVLGWALCVLTFLAGNLVAGPAVSQRHSVSIDDGDGPVADCSGLHIRFDHREAVVRSEERTLSQSEAGTLRVRAEENGGVQVQGWDNNTYSVTVCKAAAPGDDAEQLISQIKLLTDGGEVRISGPSHRDNWAAYLLVRAPKSATLDVRASNGPMGIYGLSGKVTARAVNGPVTLKDCTGEANISSENGPIRLDGNAGNLKLRTQNGPVNISLHGTKWNGAGLEVSAENGPLTLRVPADFQSSFVVENQNAPMNCHASICGQARKTWDDERRKIEFGSEPATIRLKTVNGPVSVE